VVGDEAGNPIEGGLTLVEGAGEGLEDVRHFRGVVENHGDVIRRSPGGGVGVGVAR
jgi:hypothetical protein